MKRLDLTFLAMGFSCSISQVLLARELMNIFSGNELVLGVMFVNWFLCIAIGSWGLGRLVEKSARRNDWFVVTLVFVSIILPLQILFVRSMGRWLVGEKGEMASLFSSIYATFFVLLPFCSLHGLQFSLGCKLYSEGNREDSPAHISRVYVLEALGSVIGGLAFSYVLAQSLRTFDIALGLSFLFLSLAFLLYNAGRVGQSKNPLRRLLRGVLLLFVVIVGSTLPLGGAEVLDSISYKWQWEGLGLIHTQNSIYGNIAITQMGGQLDFWVNGLPLFTTPDPDKEFVEEIVHFPMLQHDSPEKVLLIGGGLGGVLEELVKHPVVRITYVELDPLLIKLYRDYVLETSGVLEDPRVDVVYSDGRRFIKGVEEYFDVVIVNLPPPSTLQLNRFYSIEFFREVHGILDENGVISLSLPSSLAHKTVEMTSRNKCIYDALKEVFPSILVVPGYHDIFLASSAISEVLTSDANVLYQRLVDRGLETSLFTSEHLEYKLYPERMKIALAYIEKGSADVNSDMRPVAVYHDLALWNVMFDPQTSFLFSIPSRGDLLWFMVLLALMSLALLMVRGRLRPGVPVFFAIFTTGLSGMTLSIIMLYSYQALLGYLYQELGVLTAAFMLGLALGGWFMGQKISNVYVDIPALFKTELAVALCCLLTPVILGLLSSPAAELVIQYLARLMLPLLNCAAGFFVGLEFSLAGKLLMRNRDRVGGVAGALYASDLVGACVGSLLSSVWLIPLFGVLGACVVTAGLNLTSLIFLFIVLRSG